jgi:hypothetical protein
MKTAVEFYREELNALVSFKESKFKTEQEIFEQAKEMEKEQIKKSFSDGAQWELYGSDLTYEERAEQYYNITFKQK